MIRNVHEIFVFIKLFLNHEEHERPLIFMSLIFFMVITKINLCMLLTIWFFFVFFLIFVVKYSFKVNVVDRPS